MAPRPVATKPRRCRRSDTHCPGGCRERTLVGSWRDRRLPVEEGGREGGSSDRPVAPRRRTRRSDALAYASPAPDPARAGPWTLRRDVHRRRGGQFERDSGADPMRAPFLDGIAGGSPIGAARLHPRLPRATARGDRRRGRASARGVKPMVTQWRSRSWGGYPWSSSGCSRCS